MWGGGIMEGRGQGQAVGLGSQKEGVGRVRNPGRGSSEVRPHSASGLVAQAALTSGSRAPQPRPLPPGREASFRRGKTALSWGAHLGHWVSGALDNMLRAVPRGGGCAPLSARIQSPLLAAHQKATYFPESKRVHSTPVRCRGAGRTIGS